MDAEIQRRRTFEIIAKWIGQQNGITIEFHPDIVPNADPKKKIIRLPTNTKIENLDKILALVFHEAAHIAHSQFKMEKLVDCQEAMNVLNASEDIRIDNRNMNYLPKIRDFYDKLIEWEDEQCKGVPTSKIPFEHKVLCDTIRQQTGYPTHTTGDRDVAKFIRDKSIDSRIRNLQCYLDNLEYGGNDYKVTKQQIDELVDLIYGKKQRTPMPQSQGSNGQGQGQGTGQQCQSGSGQGKGKGKGNSQNDPCSQNDPTSNTQQQGGNQQGGSPGGFGCGKHASLFQIDPNAKYALNEISLTEQTVQGFNQLLTCKSKRIIHDGMILDTDNLTAYMTGDLEALFKEVKIEKYKKSKIIMLLDSSGSMRASDGICDTKMKCDIVANVATRLEEILIDVREQEGINVDYDVRGFDDYYHVWDKNDWVKQYRKCPGGGTNCTMAFDEAQKEILKDPSADGVKMVILITDGQIDIGQIDKIREMILKHGADIRCMLLGVGLSSQFEQKLGGRNILSDQLADGEILMAIEEMLD